MTAEYGFRSLVVWQKAQALAVAVTRATRGVKKDRASEAIALQLVRAAGSVSANIAEGYGRYSTGALCNHLSIARGSLFETESWIDLLQRSGYLNQEGATALTDQCHEVGRILTVRMKQLESGAATIREEGVEYEV